MYKSLTRIGVAIALATLICVASATAAPGKRSKKNDKPAKPEAEGPAPTVIELGGEADQVRSGAGGRILVFHLKGSDKLTVVDVVAGKVLKQIPAPGDFHYAADADKLLLVLNNQRVIQRWDLKTLEREKTVLLPDDRPVRLVSMGSAGHGPLAVWPAGKVEFWDVSTLKPLEVRGTVEDHDQGALWPSADGLTFASWGWSTVPYDIMQLSNVTGASAECIIRHTPDGEDYNESWAMPNADGSLLVRHGAQPYNLLTPEVARMEPGPLKGSTLLPTEDPRFLLALRRTDRYKSEGNTCAIVAAVDLRVLFTMQEIEPVTGGMIGTLAGRLGPEPRVHYLPDEKLLVTFPESNDKVVVHSFDLKQSLDATGADYLFVISKPWTRLNIGDAFNYQVETLSRAGGIHYKFEEAPKGMTVSETGLVTWKPVPAVEGGKAGVVLDITDSSGQEVQHVIVLNVMQRVAGSVPASAIAAAANRPPGPVAAPANAAARLKGEWLATPVFDPAKIRAFLAKDVPGNEIDDAVATFQKKMAGFRIVYAFNEDGTAVGSFGTDADPHSGKAAWKVLKDGGETARIGITPEGGKPDEMDLVFEGPNRFKMELTGPDLPVQTPVTFDRRRGPAAAPKVNEKPDTNPVSETALPSVPSTAPASAGFSLVTSLHADDGRIKDALLHSTWTSGNETLRFMLAPKTEGTEAINFVVNRAHYFPPDHGGKQSVSNSTSPAALHDGLLRYGNDLGTCAVVPGKALAINALVPAGPNRWFYGVKIQSFADPRRLELYQEMLFDFDSDPRTSDEGKGILKSINVVSFAKGPIVTSPVSFKLKNQDAAGRTIEVIAGPDDAHHAWQGPIAFAPDGSYARIRNRRNGLAGTIVREAKPEAAPADTQPATPGKAEVPPHDCE